MTYATSQSIWSSLWFEAHEEVAQYWCDLYRQQQRKKIRDEVVDVLRKYSCTPFEIKGVGSVIPLSKCKNLLAVLGVSTIPRKYIKKVVRDDKIRVYVEYKFVYRLVRKTSKLKLRRILDCA